MKPIEAMHGESNPLSDASRVKKRVTLCVDDFGMHEGINTSVSMLMAMNRLGATSVMVDGEAVHAGAERLVSAMKSDPGHAADVGLHLNLSEALRPAGEHQGYRCMRLTSLIAMAYARALDAASMGREIHRQCAAFEKIFGRAPDYVDGHQHVHQLPVVRSALIDVLVERYGWQRPWLRRTRPANGTRDWKAWLIAALGERALARLAGEHGFILNEHLLGVHDFTSDPLVYQDRMARWLAGSSDGDLLMCHPSVWTGSPGLLLAERMAEHEVLTGPGFERQLADAGIVLTRFSTRTVTTVNA